VFAKTPEDALASLVKELDKAVAAHAEKKLAAVVNFTGETSDDFQAKIAEFAKKNQIEHVALTVTKEADKFKVSETAAVTVMHYRNKEVKCNFASATAGLNPQAIQAIVAGIPKILVEEKKPEKEPAKKSEKEPDKKPKKPEKKSEKAKP
jgi:alpha-L-arabinofuranosidase